MFASALPRRTRSNVFVTLLMARQAPPLPHCDSVPGNTRPLPRQFLVPNPVWLIGLLAQSLLPLRLVNLVVALAPDRLAVSLKCQNVRRDAVEEPAVVADHHGAAAEAQD